jgi:hypothetical protein
MHTTTWSTVAVCALLALPACGPTETRARPNEGDAGLAGATDAVAVDAASDRDLGGAPSPDAAAPPACVPAPETCDGQDQDCDGRVDEAPIAASGALFSPSAAEPVGLAWAGDIWAVVQPGFPNWVFWLSFEGPTLWSTARFGAFPVDASVAMHRTGLVLAWTSAAHDLRYARLPEGGGAGTPKTVVDWAAPADALPRRPVIAADEDTLGLAFVEGEDLWFGRLDAAAGLFVGAPSRVATAPAISDLALVNEGEFGYALAWRNGDALSLARYDLTGALALAPTVVLTEDGLGPFALGANPYVSQFALLRTAGAAVLFQRFSQRGAPPRRGRRAGDHRARRRALGCLPQRGGVRRVLHGRVAGGAHAPRSARVPGRGDSGGAVHPRRPCRAFFRGSRGQCLRCGLAFGERPACGFLAPEMSSHGRVGRSLSRVESFTEGCVPPWRGA